MAPKNFNNELDFYLVEEVERRPMLWDCTLDVYRRNDLKKNAWEQIATALGPNFTSDSVADRWKNIKQTFMSNHKKVRESKNKCSGADGDGIYAPKWHLYNKLLFLEKACVQAESSSNLEPAVWNERATNTESMVSIYFDENLQRFSMIPADDPDNDLQAVGEDAATIVSNPTPSISPVTNSSFTSSSLTSPPPTSHSSANSPRLLTSSVIVPPPRPASAPCNNLYENRGTKRKSTAIMEEAINLMQKVSQPLPPPPQDDADIFGNLVATRLRGLKQEKRKECENEILIVLTRY
ncbi:uncharacterized protein LOC105828745 [Monomorium pharaonis]|uniref:uncharacterized protein LOC105828745 n=1 Tax=Monomorium pharaonis TaxID=307658 RepID=UPI00063F3650|nr:uncharacterized protein LOC105828745 [Monomorium pharaonis]